jgi:nitrite reductase/ring-hydroxylating ferredoxin subunit
MSIESTSRSPGAVERIVVARVADVPPGSRLLVEVKGREIGIFNVDGRFHALLNHCPHNGGELCRGDILCLVESDGQGHRRLVEGRKFIACPWHGWEFDLETGQSYFDPARMRTRVFATGVETGDRVKREIDDGVTSPPDHAVPVKGWVKGPFTAEVIDVAAEDDYLVILLRRPGGAAATANT